MMLKYLGYTKLYKIIYLTIPVNVSDNKSDGNFEKITDVVIHAGCNLLSYFLNNGLKSYSLAKILFQLTNSIIFGFKPIFPLIW